MMLPYKLMPDGVQEVVTTKYVPLFFLRSNAMLKIILSYLSPWAFTQTLLPLLIETAKQPGSDVRIVNVCRPAISTVCTGLTRPLQLSSRGHRFLTPGIRFHAIDDLNREYRDHMWPEMTRYGLSKLAVVLWTKKLQRQFDAEGVPITAISVHPGEVYTGESRPTLLDHGTHAEVLEGASTLAVPWFLRPIYHFIVVPLAFVSVDKGVYTSLFAAAGKKVKEEPGNYRGAFLDPVAQLSKPSEDALREDLADDLWKLTNQVLKDARVF
jgi:NAD(P)-dependent dehydrogenase (short-subunit alcohol dehydrogenase family)